MNLKDFIRDVPDFPKKGIIFKDITPLLRSPEAFARAIELIVEHFQDRNISVVVSAEARGFIFGSTIAYKLSAGFAPVRKPGKLPWKTISKTYELEYGEDTLCMHKDAVKPGENVLLVDDVLATGGTMRTCVDMIKSLGGNAVGCAFLVELDFLQGRKKLSDLEVFSLIHY